VEWKGLACLLVVILGIVLFLYGANYYDEIVGWTGVGLFIGGILAYVFLRIFSLWTKSESDQKP
jgi:membrane-bound ClpP family serine protease